MAALTKERGHGRRGRGAGKGVTLALALLLSAYLMAVAVGTAGHPWLAWTSLIPLFFAIRWLRPLLALGSGVFWGAGLFLFSTTAVPTEVPATWAALALLSLVPAIYAYLGALASRRFGFNPLVLGVAWMGVELTLQPLGLRAGLLGGVVQEHATVLERVGSVLGYVLVAFCIALVNASVVSALSAVHFNIPPCRYPTRASDRGVALAPWTFFCFPRFALHPLRPRAPPFTFESTGVFT